MKILLTCVIWVCMFLTNISIMAQTPTLVKITKTESNPLRNTSGSTFGSGYVEPLGRIFYMIHTSYNNYDMVSRSWAASTNSWSSESVKTQFNGEASWAYYGSHPNGSWFYVRETTSESDGGYIHNSDGAFKLAGTVNQGLFYDILGNKSNPKSTCAVRISPDGNAIHSAYSNITGNIWVSLIFKNGTAYNTRTLGTGFGDALGLTDIIPLSAESGLVLYYASNSIMVRGYSGTTVSGLTTIVSNVTAQPADLKGIAVNANTYYLVYSAAGTNGSYDLKIVKVENGAVTYPSITYSSTVAFGNFQLAVDAQGHLHIAFHQGNQFKYTREKENGTGFEGIETIAAGFHTFSSENKTPYFSMALQPDQSFKLSYLTSTEFKLASFYPIYTISVDQKLADGITSFDQVAQVLTDGSYDWQVAPHPFSVKKGNQGTFQSSSLLAAGNSQKYYEWFGKNSWQNQFLFLPHNDEILRSQFKQIDGGGQITASGDGLTISGISGLYFRDPWYEVNGLSKGVNATFEPINFPFNLSVNGSQKGVFKNQNLPSPSETKPYYSVKVDPVVSWSGLDFSFQNWVSSGATIPDPYSNEQPVVFTSSSSTITANYKAMLASKTGNWVQSVTPYTANGTRAVAYFSPNPNSNSGLWFHQENGSVSNEVNIDDGLNSIDLSNASNLISIAVADYNKQKSYIGYFGIEPGIDKELAIREVINGSVTGFTQVTLGTDDSVVNGFSSNAKLYITPYLNSTNWPQDFNKFLIVIADGLTVYTRAGYMSNGVVSFWEPWSSFTVNSTPVFSTNGKMSYITWLQNGNVVGRRFLNSSWGSTFTLYANTGGNFLNVSATVNSSDDLVLMMTRQNSLNSRSMCFGKRYNSGSSAPVTVLETTNFSLYNAYSLATENGKILASIGKSSPDGEVFNYYLWKHDGTGWTKEATAFSSTPARLLHNEVDVRPYEFVTSTTPALYALKTTPVSWPAGSPGMNKEGDENGFSIVAAQIGDTLNWYTTVSPEAIDSIVIDSTGIWSIVVNQVSAKNILISGLNRFGSAVWIDTSSTVLFSPATARYTFWVVDPAGNKMRYHKESSETEETEFVLENKISVFPNPFNPTTVFSVSVAEPSTVKLHVFNLIGQQIAEVVNADLNAGVHDYRLNAGSWSSGTYFYRLQIGEKTKTGKIQLVK